MAITIKDIAKATGVSTMTVSRFLNEPEKLKPSTYEKVKKVVDEMGYEPNQVARLLQTNKTNIICVYIANGIDTLHPFTLRAISGIGEKLGLEGYSMQICRHDYKKVKCDGVIAMGMTEREEDEMMEWFKDKPVIVFGNSSYKNNWIDIDNYKGGYMATEHLIKRGYKKIANIGIRSEEKYTQDRLDGYMDCMRDYHMDIPQSGIMRVCNNEDDGYLAASRILKNADVDAIVCASDALALGVMRCAVKMEINVPNELGVTGFDGLGYEKLVTPHITTVEQPVYASGIALAECIVNILRNNDYSETEKFIKPILNINGSTK